MPVLSIHAALRISSAAPGEPLSSASRLDGASSRGSPGSTSRHTRSSGGAALANVVRLPAARPRAAESISSSRRVMVFSEGVLEKLQHAPAASGSYHLHAPLSGSPSAGRAPAETGPWFTHREGLVATVRAVGS